MGLAEDVQLTMFQSNETVLAEALRICEGDRQKSYGHPHDNYVMIRGFLSAIFGCEVTYTQAVFTVMALKMGRELSKHNRDNLVDIAGYAWVLEKVLERQAELDAQKDPDAS